MRYTSGRRGMGLTPIIVIAALILFGVVQPLLAHPWAVITLAAIVAATLLLRPLVAGWGARPTRSDRAMEGRMVALEESIKVLERQQRELRETIAWQARLLQETTPEPLSARPATRAE